MLLRRVIEHVRDQNWFAVWLDFLIVVVGVFIGIQVSNWNEARSAREYERRLLTELRSEMEQNSRRTREIGEGLLVGAESARRVLALTADEGACREDCWSVVVDLMHASQWQRPHIRWTTYDELRRAGLPSDRRIIESIEQYRSTSYRSAVALENAPGYRSLVRQLLPIDLQDRYWENCFIQEGGGESYLYPCLESNSSDSVDEAIVKKVLNHSQLALLLREWTSLAQATGHVLVFDQSAAAGAAIKAIDNAMSETN